MHFDINKLNRLKTQSYSNHIEWEMGFAIDLFQASRGAATQQNPGDPKGESRARVFLGSHDLLKVLTRNKQEKRNKVSPWVYEYYWILLASPCMAQRRKNK